MRGRKPAETPTTTRGAWCAWYCYCQDGPIAQAEAITDDAALRRVEDHHARHDTEPATPAPATPTPAT